MAAQLTAPLTVDSANLVDECPHCGANLRAEYDFGALDATVYVYRCGAAACALPNADTAQLYTSYAQAVGAARLAVAHARVW